MMSNDFHTGSAFRLLHLDPGGEGILQFIQVGDDQDLGKIAAGRC